MRFTIHTPSGETYTTPDNTHPHIEGGTGALHIIQDEGEWHTIAVFPAGQWTRYVPTEEDAGEHHTETWDGRLSAVWTFIKLKLEPLRGGRHYIVGDEANLYRAHRNAAKHSEAAIR